MQTQPLPPFPSRHSPITLYDLSSRLTKLCQPLQPNTHFFTSHQSLEPLFRHLRDLGRRIAKTLDSALPPSCGNGFVAICAVRLSLFPPSQMTEKPAHTKQPSHLSRYLEFIYQYTPHKLVVAVGITTSASFSFIAERTFLNRPFRWQVVVDLQILGVQAFLSLASPAFPPRALDLDR